MTWIDFLQRRVSATWQCALIGGIISLPLTIGLYWLSGMGNELSLNMVFVGGLIAGFLAKTRVIDANGAAAGLRAGIVGAAPGLWFLVDVFEAFTVVSGPLWFRSAALVLVIGTIAVVLFGLGALVGFLGAKVGGWLAEKDFFQQHSFLSN
ncbi:DUF5518 domain-containing protein [Halopenitus sp. H-Gu1]|uniref:DUF5518 domain-containing protein n=1 Tax=Halopenitus sp. H-Gu1 TaxID=3242697 RepID=UPI00359DAC70